MTVGDEDESKNFLRPKNESKYSYYEIWMFCRLSFVL